MVWIRCIRCEKLQRDFVARSFALIALVQYVLHQVSCSYETIPNAPKHYETHQNMSLGSNGVDQVRLLWKIQCDFVAQTFVLNEPVQYVLKQVSCSYGMIPNAPKYYETHRNISFGSNGVDWVLAKKTRRDFVARTFALIAPVHPVLHQVSCNYETIPNAPKHYETHQKHEFRFQLGGSGRSLWKSQREFVAQTYVLIAPVHPILHRVSCS